MNHVLLKLSQSLSSTFLLMNNHNLDDYKHSEYFVYNIYIMLKKEPSKPTTTVRQISNNGEQPFLIIHHTNKLYKIWISPGMNWSNTSVCMSNSASPHTQTLSLSKAT